MTERLTIDVVDDPGPEPAGARDLERAALAAAPDERPAPSDLPPAPRYRRLDPDELEDLERG